MIVLVFTSCEDLLIEEPKAIVSDNFYVNPEELESAVNAIYSPLRATNHFGFLYPSQVEAYSDIVTRIGSTGTFTGVDATNTTRVEEIWRLSYLSIRNANLVILNAPEASEVSEADKEKYIAEARFMRAFTYFIMIQNWEKLVLRTEKNINEPNVPLSNSDDVYNQIIEDLEYAEQHLPDDSSVAGRPTKWSAKAVLTNIYIVKENYPEAYSRADEIIKSNKFALVEVEKWEDFQNLFGPDIITTTEEIFYLKFNRSSGWVFPFALHHPNSPYLNGGGFPSMFIDTIKHSVWKDWNRADLRKQLWYPWDFGQGPNTVFSRKFYDTEQVGNYAGNDYPFYRYADILLYYAESACRLEDGPTDDAMEKLNMVHRRGYGKNSQQASEIDYKLADYPNSQSFLDLVFKERGYETAMEGKRWLDIKRLGRDKVRELVKNGQGKDIADKHFTWPIPRAEISLNDSVDGSEQNPGY